jgi:hypothetical protein
VAPCLFQSDVDYRFVGDDTVHVVVCHGCDAIKFHRAYEHVGGGNVWRLALELEDLSRALFPADSIVTLRWRQGRKDSASSVFAP